MHKGFPAPSTLVIHFASEDILPRQCPIRRLCRLLPSVCARLGTGHLRSAASGSPEHLRAVQLLLQVRLYSPQS